MTLENEIQKKILKKTDGLTQPLLGEKKLEILHPYTLEFLQLFNNSSEIEPIFQNPFVAWINSHPSFEKAYQIMLANNLISDKDKNTKLFFVLEAICANCILFIIGYKIKHAKKDLSAEIVPKKRQGEMVHKAMQRLKGAINLYKGIYCKYESKQYLLQHLLNDILSDQEDGKRNIYSSGTTKQYLIRELLTKRFICLLYMQFMQKNPEPRLIAKISLQMTELFFESMDISDATDIAKEIKKNVAEDQKFAKQSIENYLMPTIKGANPYKKR